MRSFLAIVAGVVAALVVQSAFGLVANLLYPPRVADLMSLKQVAAALEARPMPALCIDIAGYFFGALAGGYLGKRIAGSAAAAWVPAVVLAAMALVIAFNLPVPTWVMFATFLAPLLGGLIANHLAKAPAPVTDAPEVESHRVGNG